MDSAVPTRLMKVDGSLIGKKLRVAGRMLAYDPVTGLMLLIDKDVGLIVDVVLCLDAVSSEWTRERLGTVMVIGYLESTIEELPVPTIPAYAPAPTLHLGLVLRALLVIQAADLDLRLWDQAIQEGESEASIDS